MQTHFTSNIIRAFEQRYRASLINSLGGFKSVNLVGTKNFKGQSNLAIFNSIVHLGANPPLVGMIIRPDSVERHTYENILETKHFTLNHLTKTNYMQAHQTSARYPREISEFKASGLNEDYKDGFFAPYVKESNIQTGLKLQEVVELKINGTILVIGEIEHIYLPDIALKTDGFIDLESAGSITCSGLDSYHSTGKLARLGYAKPDKMPETI
jgi:flavin reductase (DIM6/NTAB) family NADH-FMN oxidoreductase RutF